MSRAITHRGRSIDPATSNDGTLTRDDVFHVLRNQRRRFALHYLMWYQERTKIGPLANAVTAWENEKPVNAITSQERKRVYNALQQTHLPTLAETGLVDYDAARGFIELTEQGRELDIYLEVVSGREIPWHEYYLALSAVSVALMSAVWFDVFPFTALPDVAWGVFVTVVFCVSAMAHVYCHRRNRMGCSEIPPETEWRNQ